MLTLYHFPSSVCAAKVRLVLQEKELPWESRIIEILKGEQFEAWYVALNPNAVVPTLVHDGEAICEIRGHLRISRRRLSAAFYATVRPYRPLGHAHLVERCRHLHEWHLCRHHLSGNASP